MASIVRAPPLLFPATARHTATVIFVHGLGDTGHGWAGAVENWRRRQRLDEVKFILPHAPAIPITCNWGMKMPGWYDIHTIDGNAESLRRNEDEAGIVLSQAYFHELIQKEMDAGIPADRIVLGGFSQGGAMSLFAGLTSRVKLAGIVALSSYLLLSLKFAELVPTPEFNKETPIFMAHGDSDQVVNTELGKKSHELLKGMGYKATLKIYEDMGHSACLEELDDVEAFLRERLPALGNGEGKSEL
ncbi:Phospholipase/carboxylesterase/thioesterase [Parachaetomium inaequale]|uniref:Acyl-protein thioesterase 1 n=1 Tax=Parachaetomium inaequale TaxID=2588326 RepID=A0AAN6SVI0_9PEZI|nr:Phospholipase/carboxylesterase/thioesterase [Parachaetomium inaequale]